MDAADEVHRGRPGDPAADGHDPAAAGAGDPPSHYTADPAVEPSSPTRWTRRRCSAPWRSARSPHRSTAPGERHGARPPDRREPRRRIHAGQPGRRGAAWATEADRRRADRVHEPRRPARRHGRRPATSIRELTYRQAADIQPFANTLVNMDLTGAQIKTVLEQQWQRGRRVPSGRSCASASAGSLHLRPGGRAGATGSPPCGWTARRIDPAAPYSVTVNSFLAAGGDNFPEFANGTDSGHRPGRPGGDGRLHGGVRRRRPAAGGRRSALGASPP